MKAIASTTDGQPIVIRKAIDLSFYNATPDPAALLFWGIGRVAVRVDSKANAHILAAERAGCEVMSYAYPWYWSTAQKSTLTPDVFLDIEPSADGKLSLRDVARKAAALTAGQPWDVYANTNGLAEFHAAGGKVRNVWLASWRYSLPTPEAMIKLVRTHYMVQIAPGSVERYKGFNWAGAGLLDLSIYGEPR